MTAVAVCACGEDAGGVEQPLLASPSASQATSQPASNEPVSGAGTVAAPSASSPTQGSPAATSPDVSPAPATSGGGGGMGGAHGSNGGATSAGGTGGEATAGGGVGGADASGGANTGGDTSGGQPAGGAGGAEDPGPMLPMRVLMYHTGRFDSALDMDSIAAKLTEWGFESDRTDDPAMLTLDNLGNYAAVAMLNPCFDAFGSDGTQQAEALTEFVETGGAIWGNHCASVTYRDADPPHPWNQLLGGRGNDGFWEGDNSCRKLAGHPTVAALPETFDYNGNLDNTDFLADDITVLVRCTWGGNGNRDVVISWTREPGDGRIFFSNFNKYNNDLLDATIGDAHLWPGLAWALRLEL